MADSETGRETMHDAFQYLIASSSISHKKQNISEMLNDHFLTMADTFTSMLNMIIQMIMPSTLIMTILCLVSQAYSKYYLPMYSKPSTAREIENIFHSLEGKDSCGYDEISMQIMKLRSPFISTPLNFVYNRILSTGKFPDRLKCSIVKPLHKKCNKQMSNYKLTSLLKSLSEIVEKIMQTRLINHLTKYNILSSQQYGFRENLTTDNATYQLTYEISTAMNNKSKAGDIFCDTEKAFGFFNHNILLFKMELYGMIGKEITLYAQYPIDINENS